MNKDRVVQKEKYKFLVMAVLLAGACFLTYYYHVVLGRGTFFTHLFYIPIILAALWWKRKGIFVAVFLATILVASHLLIRSAGQIQINTNDYLRALMFIVVAVFTAYLSVTIVAKEKEVAAAAAAAAAAASLERADELAKSEEELRKTSDYLNNLIHYASAPIIVWDPGLKITRFNTAFELLSGYKAEGVIGRDLNMLFPEESRDESLQEIRRALAGEYWESVEIPILRKDGEVRLALWNSANIFAEDGTTMLSTIAQGIDITERKRAEETIRRNQEHLRDLINIAAHELRHPATIFRGYANILLEHWDSLDEETIKDALLKIDSATDRLTRIVDQFLDTSRIEGGKMGLSCSGVSPMALINNVFAEAQVKGYDNKLNITPPPR